MLQVTANALRQQVTNNEGLSVKVVLCACITRLSFLSFAADLIFCSFLLLLFSFYLNQ